MLGLLTSIKSALCRIAAALGDVADMAESTRDRLREQLGHDEPARMSHNGEAAKPARRK